MEFSWGIFKTFPAKISPRNSLRFRQRYSQEFNLGLISWSSLEGFSTISPKIQKLSSVFSGNQFKNLTRSTSSDTAWFHTGITILSISHWFNIEKFSDEFLFLVGILYETPGWIFDAFLDNLRQKSLEEIMEKFYRIDTWNDSKQSSWLYVTVLAESF